VIILKIKEKFTQLVHRMIFKKYQSKAPLKVMNNNSGTLKVLSNKPKVKGTIDPQSSAEVGQFKTR
jgi:hypothetical protein